MENNNIYADHLELETTYINCGAPELAKYLTIYHDLDIDIFADDPLVGLANKLKDINEALTYEEAENLGIGKRARILRMMWRDNIRFTKKHMKQRIRNGKLYNKEWSTNKQVYVSNLTGECHNGIYWTIRACIDTPQLIKYGFTKEDK